MHASWESWIPLAKPFYQTYSIILPRLSGGGWYKFGLETFLCCASKYSPLSLSRGSISISLAKRLFNSSAILLLPGTKVHPRDYPRTSPKPKQTVRYEYHILPSLHEFPMLMCLILLPPQSQNYLAGMITGSISLAQSGTLVGTSPSPCTWSTHPHRTGYSIRVGTKSYPKRKNLKPKSESQSGITELRWRRSDASWWLGNPSMRELRRGRTISSHLSGNTSTYWVR